MSEIEKQTVSDSKELTTKELRKLLEAITDGEHAKSWVRNNDGYWRHVDPFLTKASLDLLNTTLEDVKNLTHVSRDAVPFIEMLKRLEDITLEVFTDRKKLCNIVTDLQRTINCIIPLKFFQQQTTNDINRHGLFEHFLENPSNFIRYAFKEAQSIRKVLLVYDFFTALITQQEYLLDMTTGHLRRLANAEAVVVDDEELTTVVDVVEEVDTTEPINQQKHLTNLLRSLAYEDKLTQLHRQRRKFSLWG